MDFYSKNYRLKKVHKMILEGKTGTPAEFAVKLRLKVRQLYNILADLKSRNLPIKYSRKAKTYYYTHDFDWDKFVDNGRL